MAKWMKLSLFLANLNFRQIVIYNDHSPQYRRFMNKFQEKDKFKKLMSKLYDY